MSTETRKFKILFIAGAGVGGQLLARILRRRGHKVSVLKPKAVIKKKPSGFDFVLITTYSNLRTLRDAILARNTVIERCPGATTVLGGPGFSEQPEGYLRQFEAQYGLVGEADRTIEELFEVFEKFGENPKWGKIKHIHGAVYRATNNHTYLNPTRPSLEADEVEWNLLPSCLTAHGTDIHFNFQRGCPNQCSFCCKWFGDKVRSAPIGVIFETLERVAASRRKKSINQFSFDGELFLPRTKALELCQMIQKSPGEYPFNLRSDFTVRSLMTSDGNPDKELIDALIGAGFNYMGLGVESFRDNILQELGKPQTLAETMKLICYLKEKGLQGHFYIIERTVEARPYDVLMDSYIRSTVWGNGYLSWQPAIGRLEINPGTAMFERYKHDPTRFRDKQTGRVLHPSTNLDQLARRRILVCEAVPYDPLVDMKLDLIELLWGMESRLEHLQQTAQDRDEQEKLGRELQSARKVISRMPKHFACKVEDITFKIKQNLVQGILIRRGFLKRWRDEMGERARLIEHRVGKELYGPNWQEEVRSRAKRRMLDAELKNYLWKAVLVDSQGVAEYLEQKIGKELYGACWIKVTRHDPEKRKVLDERVQGELWVKTLVKCQKVLPASEIRRALRKAFDDVLHYPNIIEVYAAIPALMHTSELKTYRENVISSFKQMGRAKFIELAMSKKDPLGFFAFVLVMSQLDSCKFVQNLHRIDPRRDSRPFLPTAIGDARSFRKLRKAALTLPAPRS